MHLVGFSIRIYHDARSPERQTLQDITGNANKTPTGHIAHALTFCSLKKKSVLTLNLSNNITAKVLR